MLSVEVALTIALAQRTRATQKIHAAITYSQFQIPVRFFSPTVLLSRLVT